MYIISLMLACAAAGCATEIPAEDNTQKRAADIATLNNIMKLEESLAAYALTLPDVETADVKVRSNAAVAILTQKENETISDESISKLRDKIAADTGIIPENIKIIRTQR